MKMSKIPAVVCFCFFFFQLQAQQTQTCSLGKVKLDFFLDKNGSPVYEVTYNNKIIIAPSRLGFALNTDSLFYNSFTVTGTERNSFDQTWQTVWGETKDIRNHYEELTVHLKSSRDTGVLLNIIFRVFEDGVGFRYEFPLQPKLKYFIVTDELTQFNLTGNHKTFWIPGDYDTNEYHTQHQSSVRSTTGARWQKSRISPYGLHRILMPYKHR